MKRRDFSLSAAMAMPALWGGATGAAQAQVRKPVEGKDYVVLSKPAFVDAPKGKVEVVEFFWYGCPHCNAFEPLLVSWVKKLPADVAFRRVHVAFRSDFVPQQKLYQALEAMGKVDEFQRQVFRAIHVDHVALTSDNAIFDWVGKQPGLDAARFKQFYTSFDTANKVTRFTQLQDAYQIEGVPTLGIAGRYWTDGSRTGSMDRALQVTEYLVGESRTKA
ncbi:thiol:disulfide interchange protein DsbA/DsbL [Ramlibacter sp. H39-3-26]|uniref:thiol:disulfide interchange protein DsbA/DsbL n=1 Tax=Curvibacter soli TaxID=3031331 RepID=UPI0023D9E7DC|nr:thiol:disulfide interchange protein DsbA/DsbL [Ramlibacter sp. H39-3-26]MDF1486286.1 thiol:disulfide interchange protein DsbA/DsbL [Ramlibacter sp. H39-3-26]